MNQYMPDGGIGGRLSQPSKDRVLDGGSKKAFNTVNAG